MCVDQSDWSICPCLLNLIHWSVRVCGILVSSESWTEATAMGNQCKFNLTMWWKEIIFLSFQCSVLCLKSWILSVYFQRFWETVIDAFLFENSHPPIVYCSEWLWKKCIGLFPDPDRSWMLAFYMQQVEQEIIYTVVALFYNVQYRSLMSSLPQNTVRSDTVDQKLN